jgi:hypothetical protein
MTLKEEWARLDAGTRKWLIDNPGCVLVPAAVTAAIQQAAVGRVDVDVHGQMILSREDLDLIREKGAGIAERQPSEQFRFFDAAQPEQHRE